MDVGSVAREPLEWNRGVRRLYAFVARWLCASCRSAHDLWHPGRTWLAPGVAYYYTCPVTGVRSPYSRPAQEPTMALGGAPAGAIPLDDAP
jgi:hypothetical protein